MRHPPRSPLLPPLPSAAADKAAWRAWASVARRSLATPERGERVVHALQLWAPFLEATAVLTYLAFRDEIDLSPAFEGRLDDAILTRSLPGPDRRLSLHRLDLSRLERLSSGLRQPRPESPEVEPEVVDLALLPGLAFDLRGQRLGYGRGYFDRFLPRLRPGVFRVGVTFDDLVVDALPHDAHDVRVTHLATESGIRSVAAP